MKTSVLSDMEKRRYMRQIMLEELGIEGQLLLKKSKILVIGAGGLGTPALQYLTVAGVGLIGICDSDYVNESNFHRQILYGSSDLGKLKTIVAKEKLKFLNPVAEFNIHNIAIKAENAEFILKNYDIVLDCTDNFSTRYIINDTCKTLKKPLVYGAINKFEGQVSVFHHKSDFNLRTIYPEQPSANVIAKANEAGIIGVVPGIIGCIQASEAIKIAINAGHSLSNRLLKFDFLNMECSIVKF